MESSVEEIKSRIVEVKNRFEILKLREDIRKYIDSSQFQQLSEDDKELVMDLLAVIHSKEDQYTGCDPLNSASRCWKFHIQNLEKSTGITCRMK